MGEWMKPHNVKWGAETDAQAEFLFGTYPELERNFSRLVRRAICRWYRNAIAPSTLQQLGEIIQGLHCAQSVRTAELPHEEGGALKLQPQRVRELGLPKSAQRPAKLKAGPTYRGRLEATESVAWRLTPFRLSTSVRLLEVA